MAVSGKLNDGVQRDAVAQATRARFTATNTSKHARGKAGHVRLHRDVLQRATKHVGDVRLSLVELERQQGM